jgi:formylglycine-generating enzyme required for sulfatase activity
MKRFSARPSRVAPLAALAAAALALAAALGLAASPALAQTKAARAKPASFELAQGEKRVALVIGNSAYPEAPLRNPVNDARAMAQALRGRGFDVILRENATKPQMESAAADFGERLSEGSTGVFFFAGHGIQVGGRNYLVPVDARITSEPRVRLETLDVEAVLDQMAAARARVSMVILDACRNNPFERRFRSAGSGLVQISAPEGTLLAYATAPGKTAADGDGSNGLYTRELLRALATPGLKVEDVFKQVRVNVSRASNGVQVPWEASSLTGDFYFSAPAAPAAGAAGRPAAAAPAAQGDRELAFWESIRNSADPREFEAYLQRYPDGTFADLARTRLESLRTAAVPPRRPAPPGASPAQPAVALPPATPTTAGAVFRDCPDCPAMVVVPPGEFTMGSPPGEKGRESHEDPQRRVAIARAFAVGRFEVTRGEYAAFIRDSGRTASGCRIWTGSEWRDDPSRSWRDAGFAQDDAHPATCVNWEDARDYATWLSRRTGKPYRLLTEAEWEYAARAGTVTRRWWGDDLGEREACTHANPADHAAKDVYPGWNTLDCRDGYPYTAPVGSFPANPFGLHDMLGNVWEWVEDCWTDGYAGAPVDGSAVRGAACERRVQRGGAWDSYPRMLRAAARVGVPAGMRNFLNGFRVARAL